MKSILFALALLLPMTAMGQGRDSTLYHGLTEAQFEKLLDTVTQLTDAQLSQREISRWENGTDPRINGYGFDLVLLSRLEAYEKECWADSTFANDGGWYKYSDLDSIVIDDNPRPEHFGYLWLPRELRPSSNRLTYNRPEIVYIYRSYEWRENKFDGAFPMNPRWVHDMQPTLPGFISFMRKRVKE